MKITFNLNYHTMWGEELYICGDLDELGNGDAREARQMSLIAPDMWRFELDLPGEPRNFNYWFIVKAPDRAWRFEWGEPHHFRAGANLSEAEIYDAWQDMPQDKPFYSSAFTDAMLRRPHRDQPLLSRPGTLNIRVSAPLIEPGQILAMAGEGKALGNWDPHQAVRMNDANYPIWEANIPLADLKVPFDYKFVVLDKKTFEPVKWESSDNRSYGIVTPNPNTQVVVDGLRFANWNADWKGAGTAIPIFSIRSEEDFGVGDFIDVKKMVDWCAKTGQKVLQVLPINDTTKSNTWVDSYPYSANSTFALHPMYMRLEAAGKLRDPERRKHFENERLRLNALPQIDYEEVNRAKHEYLHELYKEQGEQTAAKPEYRRFVADNEYWLRPYAAWSVLRDQFGTPDNSQWGDFSSYNKEAVEEYCRNNAVEIGYYYFLQYHLDRQLREVRDYAHHNGVVLKGDIPIGIGRYSVDAWQSPELFNMDMQAGAPPDDFSVLGQNWGFPTYNWDNMARDGFQWWKHRFGKMAEYFDAYRIDHILGFFRIWQIPIDDLHGLLGFFHPALPFSPEEMRHDYDFWIDPDVMCRPYIFEWMLGDFFGEYTDEVKSVYLESEGFGRYRLKPFVDTQVKVRDLFSGMEQSEKNKRICDALMGLIDDVLFIEDPYQKGHYHPRISAQFSYQYRALNDYQKWCFNRLYNDFFYHRHNDFWYGKAMWKLPPLLDSTSMLTCAEDLGMIPDCVPEVMRRLEILALEIQRMPKNPEHEFGHTWSYPYYSVCTTSTHDMAGIRAWWESDHAMAQKFFNNMLHEPGEAPYFAEPWICDKIIDMHLKSPSMLCILPLQDWLSTDADLRRQDPREEQINVPANPTHYWRYRMHLTVEQLLAADSFNASLLDQIQESHR
ncbi:MAG: 4-alpha-glucanotransferase [Muribaculaceae bacterium]|nr:4-alpha-glucanotransferase [Muribaculaceae bacterium]